MTIETGLAAGWQPRGCIGGSATEIRGIPYALVQVAFGHVAGLYRQQAGGSTFLGTFSTSALGQAEAYRVAAEDAKDVELELSAIEHVPQDEGAAP